MMPSALHVAGPKYPVNPVNQAKREVDNSFFFLEIHRLFCNYSAKYPHPPCKKGR